MKIAFTAKGTDWDAPMDARFGRAEYLLVYDEDAQTFAQFDNRAIKDAAHGAGPQTAQNLFEMHPDVLITGNGPGGNAATVLEKAGVKIYIGAGDKTIKEAYTAYRKNQLKEF